MRRYFDYFLALLVMAFFMVMLLMICISVLDLIAHLYKLFHPFGSWLDPDSLLQLGQRCAGEAGASLRLS